MLELLKFIFSDWKIFLGTIILMYIFGDCIIINICNTFIKCKTIDYYKNKENND